jgi:hypothetical protein
MDNLTFISNLVGHMAWPVVVALGLVLLKMPASELIRSLKPKKARIGSFELEFEEAAVSDDQKLNDIATYLTQSAHSFQWLRENTQFKYSNGDFQKLINNNRDVFKPVTIIKRDEEGHKLYPGLPGVKLTAEARKKLEAVG